MRKIDFESELNDEQLAAVTAPDGPVLVIAAAGTGKTRTLVYRVAYLVEQGIDPQRLLLLTFTNRAAREMLERAQELVGGSVSGIWGGTFHHMANRLLRRHGDLLGYGREYTILDQDDAKRLMRDCVRDLKLADKHFPKPDVLLSLSGLASSMARSMEEVAAERFEHTAIDVSDVAKVHRRYTARKRELNAMDFDDLLTNGLKLFREHPAILDRYRERFLHTLVDEYQDTNHVQAEWVDLIAGPQGNLLVVGDDFQSIYSWRGADFKNIITFPDRYPGTRIYKLETNYRSVPEILEVANACIAGNPEQFQKTLRPVRERYQKPVLAIMRDGQEQARYVIEQTDRLRASGYKMSEIVVLYRSHYQALDLQLELTRRRMPYVITSGVRFFEQAHIKDVCALPRLLNNPGDELAFRRLLGLWPRVGDRTASRLWTQTGQRCDLRKPVLRERLEALLPAPAREAFRAVAAIAADYEKDELSDDPGEIIHRFVKGFYDLYAVETFDNYDRRMEDIQELINYAARFESVDAFLSEIALQTNLDAEADPIIGTEGAEALRLSTVHQAKGLEWRVVLVLWVNDGLFPVSRALVDGSESEERRLFYVALTRAKDELYLCVPRIRRTRDGGVNVLEPSRFIGEIDPELLDEQTMHVFM